MHAVCSLPAVSAGRLRRPAETAGKLQTAAGQPAGVQMASARAARANRRNGGVPRPQHQQQRQEPGGSARLSTGIATRSEQAAATYAFANNSETRGGFGNRIKALARWMHDKHGWPLAAEVEELDHETGKIQKFPVVNIRTMTWPQFEDFLSSQRKQQNPDKGRLLSSGHLEKYKAAVVWWLANREVWERW